MRNTFLITGASGMLGSRFTSILKGSSEDKIVPLTHAELDVTNADKVMDYADLLDTSSWIIHCAASTDPDGCESDRQEAEKVIIGGTQNIFELAKKTNCRVFYPQTFLIYSETQQDLTEQSPTNPILYYGRLKLEAEKVLSQLGSRALVVRMGGFFGGWEKDKRFVGKFLKIIEKCLELGQDEIEVGDRIWQPTYIDDIVKNSMLLMNANCSGIFNMSSQGEASFYDIAQLMINEFSLTDKIKLKKISNDSVSIAEKARRPSRIVMSNERLKMIKMDHQRDWRVSLKEYLNTNEMLKLKARFSKINCEK